MCPFSLFVIAFWKEKLFLRGKVKFDGKFGEKNRFLAG